jgi:hypothetical protein
MPQRYVSPPTATSRPLDLYSRRADRTVESSSAVSAVEGSMRIGMLVSCGLSLGMLGLGCGSGQPRTDQRITSDDAAAAG